MFKFVCFCFLFPEVATCDSTDCTIYNCSFESSPVVYFFISQRNFYVVITVVTLCLCKKNEHCLSQSNWLVSSFTGVKFGIFWFGIWIVLVLLCQSLDPWPVPAMSRLSYLVLYIMFYGTKSFQTFLLLSSHSVVGAITITRKLGHCTLLDWWSMVVKVGSLKKGIFSPPVFDHQWMTSYTPNNTLQNHPTKDFSKSLVADNATMTFAKNNRPYFLILANSQLNQWMFVLSIASTAFITFQKSIEKLYQH